MRDSHQAYLLRLKRRGGQAVWHATLENAYTGELLHFATEREMVRYLLQVLGHGSPEHNPKGKHRSHPNL